MVSQKDLQKYLVRAVTGNGARIQTDISTQELDAATKRISMTAGMASLTFQKQEFIIKLVEEVRITANDFSAFDGLYSSAVIFYCATYVR
jgi:hypothetical protein